MEPATKFQKYKTYLETLFMEITSESTDGKLASAKRGEFTELTNVLKWARE
ncbi:MAG: hypothetical protein EZS28_035536, partial [Streblomastix strix]